MFIKKLGYLAALCTVIALPFAIHAAEPEAVEVLAVADEALARISAEDSVGLTDLMIEQAVIYVGALRDGAPAVRTSTWAENRARSIDVDLHERGFEPTVMLSGTIAVVWYPYDIYVDGAWSHCGVDVFNLVRTVDGWRIAALMYNVQQPPECAPHPDGPPHPSGE